MTAEFHGMDAEKSKISNLQKINQGSQLYGNQYEFALKTHFGTQKSPTWCEALSSTGAKLPKQGLRT